MHIYISKCCPPHDVYNLALIKCLSSSTRHNQLCNFYNLRNVAAVARINTILEIVSERCSKLWGMNKIFLVMLCSYSVRNISSTNFRQPIRIGSTLVNERAFLGDVVLQILCQIFPRQTFGHP